MKRSLRMGLAALIASGAVMAAGSAGAAYVTSGYQQCLQAGNAHCQGLYGGDPDAFTECMIEFSENCRILWGEP